MSKKYYLNLTEFQAAAIGSTDWMKLDVHSWRQAQKKCLKKFSLKQGFKIKLERYINKGNIYSLGTYGLEPGVRWNIRIYCYLGGRYYYCGQEEKDIDFEKDLLQYFHPNKGLPMFPIRDLHLKRIIQEALEEF